MTANKRDGWVRPMAARDPGEPHRSATPLELLFDLCFVVAIAITRCGHTQTESDL